MKDKKMVNVIDKFITSMSDEHFAEFSKTCNEEQVKSMEALRLFNKEYADMKFYESVRKALAKANYEVFRSLYEKV